MSINRQDSRHRIKRSNLTGVTPTVHTASTDFTDGTWLNTDIREGEFFYNIPDIKLWIGTGTSSREIEFVGGTAGAESLADTLTAGNIIPTDQTIRGASYSYISMGETTFESAISIVSGDNLSGTATWSSIVIDSVNGSGLAISNDTTGEYSQISILPTYINMISSDASNTSIIEVAPNNNKTTFNNVIKVERGANISTSSVGTQSISSITDIIDDEMLMVKGFINAKSSTSSKAYGATFYAVFNKYGGTIYQIGTTDIVEKENISDGTTIDISTDGTSILINVIPNNVNTTNWTTIYEYSKNSLI